MAADLRLRFFPDSAPNWVQEKEDKTRISFDFGLWFRSQNVSLSANNLLNRLYQLAVPPTVSPSMRSVGMPTPVGTC